MREPQVPTLEDVKCYHCGDPCLSEKKIFEDKVFCCVGCKTVYELFQDDDLIGIYNQSKYGRIEVADKYSYLDNEKILDDLIDFKSEQHNSLKVVLPAIHCSSCIYLLENLHKLNSAVLKVNVNFVSKTAYIHYNPKETSLKSLAELLETIGYPPQFKKESVKENKQSVSSGLTIKIGVAAFCFGNIMLLSFPEYLGIEEEINVSFPRFFSYANILLSLPVVFYSASDYFVSAFKGLKNRFINIDVPIALGVMTLFLRSTYEIATQIGSGYLDSLAGLIFFLLIGRWFQNKTYDNLRFDHNYKSYFPLSVLKVENDLLQSVSIGSLKEGDEIVIRNQEIIPTDAILLSDQANIDYSFVTGEEKLVEKKNNEYIYAGGRLVGQNISLKVIKKSSQSYLTELWNNQVFKNTAQTRSDALTDKISKYFTLIILSIALIAWAYWTFVDKSQSWQVFTAVLIVACPCALALSAPFTNGNALRIFGRNKFYLKNAGVAERMASIDTIVFDKTGTLTVHGQGGVHFYPDALSDEEHGIIYKLIENSTHPISKKIKESLIRPEIDLTIEKFDEIPGRGIVGIVDDKKVKLGSEQFVLETADQIEPGLVYVSIDGVSRGYFKVENHYREGVKELINNLKQQFDLIILSGDNDQEKDKLLEIFPESTKMFFKQQPQDKLDYVKGLQNKGKKVMMLGDGLNDAGALKQSDIGVAVTEDISLFSPACDGILEGQQLTSLDNFLGYSHLSRRIIITSFIISFLYNGVGLGFAVVGALTPVFAAVLMPLSSISIVLFTTVAGNLFSKTKNLT